MAGAKNEQPKKVLVTRKLLVYLDSSDYSVLSDPKRMSAEVESVLARLEQFKKEGRVSFVYSGAAICEMAPQEATHATYAEDRANLLSKLCDRNALVSFDRLIAGEAAQVGASEPLPFIPLSEDGDWFPEMKGLISPVDLVQVFRQKMTSLKAGLNRKQRRAAESSTFRRGSLRGSARDSLSDSKNQRGFDELLAAYPMRPGAARILWNHVAGTATKKQAEDAFLESLRDPKWMMSWFHNHHDTLSPVVTWLRGPSVKAAGVVREAATKLRAIRKGGDSEEQARLIKEWRPELIESVWSAIVERSAGSDQTPGIAAIEERSAGLNVMLNAYYTVFADAALTEREPKDSDFADMMHAAYSPYVDIFRADRYMAPHVQRIVTRYGTKVVSRLTELPRSIETALRSSSGISQ
ncbi:hypothetical protein [Pseudoxanthomonas sacheonensis]|uniref:Uncharacterized protein n=1 Tax=Pseudoxanthomonas sacheonensis TaxID=443615 RepID=A0ABU1RRC6_9GAMM|nr:hypothetical protein [Pseudoxanthomonas sacheonensis]MDR6841330.1 hypothetical protein [Pseudoxanthomonas sacheonensis]